MNVSSINCDKTNTMNWWCYFSSKADLWRVTVHHWGNSTFCFSVISSSTQTQIHIYTILLICLSLKFQDKHMETNKSNTVKLRGPESLNCA